MVKKKTIIIGLFIIIILLAAATCFLVVGTMMQKSNTPMNFTDSCSCMVPYSKSATLSNVDSVQAYEDKENNLTVVYYNTESSEGQELMSSVVNKTLTGQTEVVDGITVHHNSDTGMYSIFVTSSKTHDCILITCNDVNLLLEIYNSILFNGISIAQDSSISHDTSVILTNQQNSTSTTSDSTSTTSTSSSTSSSSSSSSSSSTSSSTAQAGQSENTKSSIDFD